jgi:hypothetical protein
MGSRLRQRETSCVAEARASNERVAMIFQLLPVFSSCRYRTVTAGCSYNSAARRLGRPQTFTIPRRGCSESASSSPMRISLPRDDCRYATRVLVARREPRHASPPPNWISCTVHVTLRATLQNFNQRMARTIWPSRLLTSILFQPATGILL